MADVWNFGLNVASWTKTPKSHQRGENSILQCNYVSQLISWIQFSNQVIWNKFLGSWPYWNSWLPRNTGLYGLSSDCRNKKIYRVKWGHRYQENIFNGSVANCQAQRSRQDWVALGPQISRLGPTDLNWLFFLYFGLLINCLSGLQSNSEQGYEKYLRLCLETFAFYPFWKIWDLLMMTWLIDYSVQLTNNHPSVSNTN